MAVARVALPSGSGPPSRAATMIALVSFEKSLPRLASTAPFLCLMLDHLLCPDMLLLPHQVEEALVHARVVRQLGMEGRAQDAPLPYEDRLAAEPSEHLDGVPGCPHPGRADEDAPDRVCLSLELDGGLEARHLAAEGVAHDLDVQQAEVRTVEDDHPGAGAEERALELGDGLFE